MLRFSETDNRTEPRRSPCVITHCSVLMEGEFGSSLKINCLNFFFFRLFVPLIHGYIKINTPIREVQGEGETHWEGERDSRDRAGCSLG